MEVIGLNAPITVSNADASTLNANTTGPMKTPSTFITLIKPLPNDMIPAPISFAVCIISGMRLTKSAIYSAAVPIIGINRSPNDLPKLLAPFVKSVTPSRFFIPKISPITGINASLIVFCADSNA